MPALDHFTRSQSIHRAAIGALGFTGFGYVQKYARVAVPELHPRFGVWAVDAAVGIEVGGAEFDDQGGVCGGGLHGHTRVSQWVYFGLRPLTMSKNAVWIFSVTGPRMPAPMVTRSSSRIGVTSAAVPVKNASSAM